MATIWGGSCHQRRPFHRPIAHAQQGKTAPRALGYSQFLRVLDGETTVPEAAGETIVATRQFARRQLTWFRADPRITWLDWQDPGLTARAAALCG